MPSRKTAIRPYKGKKVKKIKVGQLYQIAVRFDREVFDALSSLSHQEKMSISGLVNEICSGYMTAFSSKGAA